MVDSSGPERLPAENPRVLQLAPDPETGGIIALVSLTDLLVSCSSVLARDAARTGDDDLPGSAPPSPCSEDMADSDSTAPWVTTEWAAGTGNI